MKKKLGIMLLAVTLLFAGCQSGTQTDAPAPTKGPEGTETIQPENSEDLAETPEATESPDATKTPDATKAPDPTATTEPKNVEPMLYDRLAAWDAFYKEYGSYYTAVQIEDMFFYPGMLGKELAEVVSASKDRAITAVSMDKLMEPDAEELSLDTQKVTYYRNAVPWFDVYVRNYAGDLLPLGDCIVSAVMPSTEAMAYCRFFDGTYTLNSLKEINYQEYDSVKASIEAIGYTMEKEGSTWRICSKDDFCPASLSEDVLYWVDHNFDMELQINSDTGYVTEMHVENNRTYKNSICELYTEEVPDNFDWSNPECAKRLAEFSKGMGIYVINEAESVETVSVFAEEKNTNYTVVIRVKNSASDTPLSYVVCRMYNIAVDYAGNLVLSDEMTNWGHDSTALPSYIKTLEYIDSLFKNKKKPELLYEYDKDLIKEYKTVKSFSDLNKTQLLALVEEGAKRAPHDAPWGEEVNVVPAYITFGDSEKESGDFEGNRLWLIYVVSYTFLGDWIEQLAYVELHDMYVDVEGGGVGFAKSYAENGWQGKTYTPMKELWQLNGKPENNIWVTELLPRDFAQAVMDEYQCSLDSESVAP